MFYLDVLKHLEQGVLWNWPKSSLLMQDHVSAQSHSVFSIMEFLIKHNCLFPKLKRNQKRKEISESVKAHRMCDTGSEQYPKRKEYLKCFPMWENSKNQCIQSGEKSDL
jgi:hypothetical protein